MACPEVVYLSRLPVINVNGGIDQSDRGADFDGETRIGVLK